ncbi:MAG: PHP-associated domain-containing protein [Candidatus Undinarchaeales archaeon]|jgi:hypothetical protein|nr:PHP-associated domain-containing protein [Candidatus Undinarchaeales archaeon]MDP7493015.1 PHP-associated domain-containing protein [Candidatus Undinarchaeales archaeon]
MARLDLHTHSCHSRDGVDDPRALLRAAVAHGLAGIAITDHGTLAAHRRPVNAPCLLIPGVEVMTSAGEILAYGVTEVPSGTPEEVIDSIHDQGGVAVAPHPFTGIFRNKHGLGELVERLSLDGLEVFNASLFPAGNQQARANAHRLGLMGTGGSDAHVTAQVGAGWTEVPSAESVDDVLEHLRKDRVHSGGSEISLVTRVHVQLLRAARFPRKWTMRPR